MRWKCALALCAGCFSPHAVPGATCGAGSACPEGLVCSAADTCELGPSSGPGPDGGGSGTDGSPPGIMLVQQITAYAPAAEKLTATLPSAPQAGHVLVMIGGGPHAPISAIDGVAQWDLEDGSYINLNEELWVGVADGSGADVTITVPGNTGPMFMLVSEWSGLVPTTNDDDEDSNDGNETTARPGSAIISHVPDLVIFGVSNAPPNVFGDPLPGGWTALATIDEDGVSQGAWFTIATSQGSVSPRVPVTGTAWDGAICALRGSQ